MIIAGLIILGLALGSFVNALVWRMWQQSLPVKKRGASKQELSIVSGRSMCPDCKHVLAWYDLLPFISWAMLRARCRYCKKPIHWQYPLLEVSMAGLFVASYVFWPTELASVSSLVMFVVWLMSLVGLAALAVYDTRWMLLPNRLVFSVGMIAAVGVVNRLIASDDPLSSLLMTMGAVSVGGGIFYILFQLSSGRWIGGGDVKLGFVLGLLLASPAQAFLMLFLASLLGLVVALPAVITHRTSSTTKIPFGPFLIGATIITQLFGQSIIDWYAVTFLYM